MSIDEVGASLSHVPGDFLVVGCALSILLGLGGALFVQVKNRVYSVPGTRIPALSVVAVYGAIALLLLGTLTSHSQVTGSDLGRGAVVLVCGLVLLCGWSVWANARMRRIENAADASRREGEL
ncbi:hypothetical protein [Brachybacterium kimchii]|uniref:Uncharacterized protein n=2 Tax=Brachybacterium TaxID=43668 RepID=A0ABY4NAU8_9MICO|nr:hypothetical protein [Brachybacterium kimchii]UQN30548.1 hypothetical protein M4486_04345 [Brachybacterium kimchii]